MSVVGRLATSKSSIRRVPCAAVLGVHPQQDEALGVVAERRGREHVLLQPLAPGAPVGPEVDQDRLALGLGAGARRGDVVEPTVAGRRRRADRRRRRGQTESEGEKGGQQLRKAPRRTSSSGLDQRRGLARDDTIRPPHETRSSTLADRRVRDDEGRAAGGRAQGAGHRRRELRSGRARLRIAGGGGRGGARSLSPPASRNIRRRPGSRICGAGCSSATAASGTLPGARSARPRSRWAPRRPCSSSRSRWSTTATRSSSRRRAGCRSPTRCKLCGGRPVFVESRADDGFRIRAAPVLDAITPATARHRPQLAVQPDRGHDRRRRSARDRRGRRGARHPGGLRRDLRALRLRRTGIHQLRRLRRRAPGDGGGGGLVLEDLRHDRLAHRLRAGAGVGDAGAWRRSRATPPRTRPRSR